VLTVLTVSAVSAVSALRGVPGTLGGGGQQEELVASKFLELEKALMADPRLAILYS
jgi:hypothetical protein